MSDLYYTAPSDELFNELKAACIENWKEVDHDNDKFGYATQKINRIKDIVNVQDNFMYMVAMFDQDNQALLAQKLSPECRLAIRERMLDGGQPEYLIAF